MTHSVRVFPEERLFVRRRVKKESFKDAETSTARKKKTSSRRQSFQSSGAHSRPDAGSGHYLGHDLLQDQSRQCQQVYPHPLQDGDGHRELGKEETQLWRQLPSEQQPQQGLVRAHHEIPPGAIFHPAYGATARRTFPPLPPPPASPQPSRKSSRSKAPTVPPEWDTTGPTHIQMPFVVPVPVVTDPRGSRPPPLIRKAPFSYWNAVPLKKALKREPWQGEYEWYDGRPEGYGYDQAYGYGYGYGYGPAAVGDPGPTGFHAYDPAPTAPEVDEGGKPKVEEILDNVNTGEGDATPAKISEPEPKPEATTAPEKEAEPNIVPEPEPEPAPAPATVVDPEPKTEWRASDPNSDWGQEVQLQDGHSRSERGRPLECGCRDSNCAHSHRHNCRPVHTCSRRFFSSTLDRSVCGNSGPGRSRSWSRSPSRHRIRCSGDHHHHSHEQHHQHDHHITTTPEQDGSNNGDPQQQKEGDKHAVSNGDTKLQVTFTPEQDETITFLRKSRRYGWDSIGAALGIDRDVVKRRYRLLREKEKKERKREREREKRRIKHDGGSVKTSGAGGGRKGKETGEQKGEEQGEKEEEERKGTADEKSEQNEREGAEKDEAKEKHKGKDRRGLETKESASSSKSSRRPDQSCPPSSSEVPDRARKGSKWRSPSPPPKRPPSSTKSRSPSPSAARSDALSSTVWAAPFVNDDKNFGYNLDQREPFAETGTGAGKGEGDGSDVRWRYIHAPPSGFISPWSPPSPPPRSPSPPGIGGYGYDRRFKDFPDHDCSGSSGYGHGHDHSHPSRPASAYAPAPAPAPASVDEDRFRDDWTPTVADVQRLRPDAVFTDAMIASLAQIVAQDRETMWLRIATALQDETGRAITPAQIAKKVAMG